MDTLKELKPEERKKRRQSSVKPLVEAYFAWVKEKKADGRISEKSKAGRGLSYSINQEKYLKVFLEDGNVPMDNNAAERAIKNFCIGRKNWLIIDTIRGAQSSAIIYSIAETAKANNLKPYEYEIQRKVAENCINVLKKNNIDFEIHDLLSEREESFLKEKNFFAEKSFLTIVYQ